MSFLESYQEEQRKLDAERPPPDGSRIVDLFACSAMLGVLFGTVMQFLGELPKNEDGSIRAVFAVPTFLLLSACAAYLLKKRLLRQRAFRFVCWGVLAFSGLIVPVALWAEM
jgi:ABC-type transport system involved in cytochrome c biogenesis permease subunit